MDLILAHEALKKTLLDLQKRFPMYHSCPKYLAAHHCSSTFPENGLAFRQELDEVGMTMVRLATWDSVLIQHLENLSNRSCN